MMRSQVCTRILLASFIVWFIILLFAAKHLSSIKSNGNIGQEDKNDAMQNRVEAALNKLQALQQHSEHLQNLFQNL